MTDVVFLNPPYLPWFSRESRSPCVTLSSTLYYPYTMALGTGVCEKAGFKSVLIDAVAEGYSTQETLKLVDRQSPQVVVVNTSTPSIYNDVKIGDTIQQRLCKAKVVLVGRHASLVPEETLRLCKDVVVIARREFYRQVVDLLDGKDYKEIRGVSYEEDGRVRNAPDGNPIHPDEFPFVSTVYREHLRIEKYFYSSLINPYVMLYFGFGCPYNCDFCCELNKGSYRHRAVQNTVEELKFIQKELPTVKEVLFDDATFVVNEETTGQLCDAIVESKLKVRWSVMTRCNVSLETLRKMKRAGCRLAHVGIESSSQKVLNSVSKGIDIDRETRYLFNCREVGILNHGCFIVGLPKDSQRTVKQTIEYAKKVPLETIQVLPFIPYPGTAGYDWARDNGYLTSEDYSQWLRPDGSYNCVVSRPDLTDEQVLEWCRIFRREFYFRPSYVGYKLKQSLSSLDEAKRNMTTFRSIMGRGV